MRLLPALQRKELLSQICSYARSHTGFSLPDCDLHIQVIPGETEGLYGWVAANYLLGGFDSPEQHVHGKGHHTYGFLDMGGASAQIAFAPNSTEATRHAEDLKLVRLRTINGASVEHKVFVTTWLGFGVNEARKRYLTALLEASNTHAAKELPDPCLPVGLKLTMDGEVVVAGAEEPATTEPHLIGTGKFDECLRSTFPLLDKNAPCQNEPCLLNGVHVPAIDFDVNHFVGVSEFWHTTHEVFKQAHKDEGYNAKTYQSMVENFCSQDWKTISSGVRQSKWGHKVDERRAADICFKASWLINVLHKGIGIPKVHSGDMELPGSNGTKETMTHGKELGFLNPFQAVDKIHDVEVSWTLGKMVLYAASQVPPGSDQDLPIGFGSNIAGVPSDFQFAGSRLAVNETESGQDLLDDDNDWHDQLFNVDSPRRVPGFFFLLVIVGIAVFLWCGRDRRVRCYRKFLSICGIRPAGGSKKRRFTLGGKLFGGLGGVGMRSYERVLEDGEAANEFELGDVDSDDNEHSDSSEGSALRAGRASGWATPQLTLIGSDQSARGGYFENVSTTPGLGLDPPPVLVGNAMDRSGLVVRTESRERLAPGILTAGAGRRSRAGSPTRNKSPLTPIERPDYD